MKKIGDLSPADFPGFELNEVDFNNWREAKVEAEKNVKIFALVTITIFIIALITAGTLVAPGAILVILVMFGIRSKSNKMMKTLGLTERKVLAARKGRFQV